MPTTRFCSLIGVPERTWRRHQARARAGRPAEGAVAASGPRPCPGRGAPACAGASGVGAPQGVGDVPPRRPRRCPRPACCGCCARRGCCWRRATSGNAASSRPGGRRRSRSSRRVPNQVWQLDFTEFETTTGGTWRLAGCRDYWSKYELGWHVSPTANQHDAIAAVELALAEAEPGSPVEPLPELAARDADGNVLPLVTIVTDNGGPFRSFRFEAFIATHPELRHVRTRVRTPGPERLPRARVRDAEVRAAVPRRDRRRPRPDRARRALPGRLQHRPPARGPVLEPAPRRPRRPGRPADPQLSRARNPANCLTRDTSRMRLLLSVRRV